MTDREKKFEEHIRSLGGDYNLLKVGDVYIDVETQIEWRTWQKAWQAALASQKPADDGWLHWNGERALPPVESMQRVQVRLRNGDVREHYAQNFAWRNAPTKRGVDIIAYRVVKP